MSLEVNMDKKNTRRTFTLEYKQDAVKLVTEQGYSRQKAADSLGISLSVIFLKLLFYFLIDYQMNLNALTKYLS